MTGFARRRVLAAREPEREPGAAPKGKLGTCSEGRPRFRPANARARKEKTK